MAHGRYLFKGADEPLEIFEVGEIGAAPLQVPPNTDKARRAVAADQEETLGWRPAVGLEIPERKGWVLERKLGEGGFGEVWLGEYTKTKTPRVFKFCFDAERLRSFKRELVLFRLLRDALGDRNDIAKLYEVQVDSAPFYLESEFTEDGSLVEYAQAKGGISKIPLATRLDIVARVATAVAGAHSVGVLHKDIKPSNILIYRGTDGQPMPRLTDFGIGVLTDMSQLAQRNITMVDMSPDLVDGNESSRTGTRIYTPPEALVGKPFTMQGDVYALGILLYQMVVGDLDRPLAQGWEREITDPLLREDITLCVEGHESERLSSAKELADRINTLPARRRARSRRKFARVSAASTVILAVLLTASTMLIVRERHLKTLAEHERDNATHERDKARAVNSFLQKMVGSVEPRKGDGRDSLVVDQLEKALRDVDKDFAAQPDIAAELRGTIGHAYKNLNLFAEALDPLKRALEARRHESEDSPELAQNMEDLGAVYYGQREYDQAEPLFDDSLRMRTRMFGEEHKDVATSLMYLASCKAKKGDYLVAEPMFRKAMEMRKKVLLTPDHQYDQDVAAAMGNLAWCLTGMPVEGEAKQANYKEAEQLYRDALAMVRSIKPQPPEVDVAGALNGLAFVLNLKGDNDSRGEAIEHCTEALALKRKIYGDDNPTVATSLVSLGDMYSAKGEMNKAKPLYEESLNIRRAKLRENHPDTAVSAMKLGEVHVREKNYSAAETLFREAMKIRWAEKDRFFADSQVSLGKCLTLMATEASYAEAERVMLDALSTLQQQAGPSHARTQGAIKALVELYKAWNKPDKVAQYQAMLPPSDSSAAKKP